MGTTADIEGMAEERNCVPACHRNAVPQPLNLTTLTELSDSRFLGVRVFKIVFRFIWLQCTTVRLAQSYIH